VLTKQIFNDIVPALNMKKLIITSLVFTALFLPGRLLAQEVEIICPQPYGGGVVCGVHTPVDAGLGDNLAKVGIGLLASSGIFFVLSKKFKGISA